jgi:hypothetical protein
MVSRKIDPYRVYSNTDWARDSSFFILIIGINPVQKSCTSLPTFRWPNNTRQVRMVQMVQMVNEEMVLNGWWWCWLRGHTN